MKGFWVGFCRGIRETSVVLALVCGLGGIVWFFVNLMLWVASISSEWIACALLLVIAVLAMGIIYGITEMKDYKRAMRNLEEAKKDYEQFPITANKYKVCCCQKEVDNILNGCNRR